VLGFWCCVAVLVAVRMDTLVPVSVPVVGGTVRGYTACIV